MSTILDEREQRQIAAERLSILQRADAFRALLASPGWKDIRDLHVAWAEKYHDAMSRVDTSDAPKAIEALRQWQLADEFVRLEADYIDNILKQAQEIAGTVTLEDALLMERFKNEQSESTGDSGGSRTGY